MDDKTLISIVAIVVSGATAIVGLLMSLQAMREANALAKATRRTLAHQNLSDEECALLQVYSECKSLQLVLELNSDRLGVARNHLKSEADRIVSEAKKMLTDQFERRRDFDRAMSSMSPAQIEEIIAAAYQGRKQAEAQLSRTKQSREDTVRLYLDRTSPISVL